MYSTSISGGTGFRPFSSWPRDSAVDVVGRTDQRRGIGNGVSLVIPSHHCGSAQGLPGALLHVFATRRREQRANLFYGVALVLLLLAVVPASSRSPRRSEKYRGSTPAKWSVEKSIPGKSSFMPLRVNYGGVHAHYLRSHPDVSHQNLFEAGNSVEYEILRGDRAPTEQPGQLLYYVL